MRFWSLKKRVEPGLMLGISRLAENKRVDKVLEAMAALKHRYPQLRLEWVGADFARLRATLERRVVELGLEGRVRFHGAVGGEELCRLLERAHLFVSASSYEGFGLSTIEAMSAATVVVVTAVGAHPDVVRNGVSGLLIDQDATGLAAQHGTRFWPCRQKNWQQMGEAARAATKRFSWRQIAPRYEQLYREVLRQRAGTGPGCNRHEPGNDRGFPHPAVAALGDLHRGPGCSHAAVFAVFRGLAQDGRDRAAGRYQLDGRWRRLAGKACASFAFAMRVPHGEQVARLRARAPRLVYAHFAPDGYAAMQLAERLGVPLVTALHGYDVTMSDQAIGRNPAGP